MMNYDAIWNFWSEKIKIIFGLNSVDCMRAARVLTWSLWPADREGGDDAPVFTLHLRNFHRDVGGPV